MHTQKLVDCKFLPFYYLPVSPASPFPKLNYFLTKHTTPTTFLSHTLSLQVQTFPDLAFPPTQHLVARSTTPLLSRQAAATVVAHCPSSSSRHHHHGEDQAVVVVLVVAAPGLLRARHAQAGTARRLHVHGAVPHLRARRRLRRPAAGLLQRHRHAARRLPEPRQL
uniref:Uncharacterized protein n=1 Tax=Setaria viridis TaxID=4556 RepID=A0A4V6D3J6_SETVI|nr:hypothetical protein SEVIR_7G030558v2 [Setaria viridis]